MSKTNELSIVAGFLILLIVVGVGAYYLGASNGGTSRTSVGPVIPRSPDGLLHYVSGTISTKTDDGITVSAMVPGEKQMREITIAVDTNTVITLRAMKDSKVMEREMRQYRDETVTPDGPVPPPVPYVETSLTFNELQKGMFVNVTPAAGTKVGARSIQAVSIAAMSLNVSPASSVPVAPPKPGS